MTTLARWLLETFKSGDNGFLAVFPEALVIVFVF